MASIDQRTALMVIDLQCGLAGLPFADPFDAVVKRSAALADAFRSAFLPVVLVNTDGAAPGRRDRPPGLPQFDGWTELVPELQAEPSDHRITKRSPGAFTGTDIERWLRDRGVGQVVIVGVATGTGVETTARQAYEAGFNVALAVDTMTDVDPVVHATCVERTFGRFAEITSSDEVIRLLDGRADVR